MAAATRSPPLANPDSVPAELTCSICFGVPTCPKLLPCEHIFCDNCIHQAIRDVQNACPICRKTCYQYDIRPFSRDTAIYRIWSNIQVKCLKHEVGCNWTGGIADFATHSRNCIHNKQQVADQGEIQTLKRKAASLEEESTRLRRKVASLEEDKKALELNANRLKEDKNFLEKKALRTEHTLLVYAEENSKLKRNNLVFEGSYNFSRENVVKLSQLISKYLENIPSEIDSNRIYQCVHNCYSDLVKDWSDNPKHYRTDMQMLLSTCLATAGWFSDNQMNNIRRWFTDLTT